jgi:hypothetical protein
MKMMLEIHVTLIFEVEVAVVLVLKIHLNFVCLNYDQPESSLKNIF